MTNNRKSSTRQARDREFMEQFHRVYDMMRASGVRNARVAAVHYTLRHSQPHYHVSFERAYRRLQQMRRGCRPLRNAGMWDEMWAQVNALMTSGLKMSQALEHVLAHCHASRWYLSPATVLTHICVPSAVRSRALR